MRSAPGATVSSSVINKTDHITRTVTHLVMHDCCSREEQRRKSARSSKGTSPDGDIIVGRWLSSKRTAGSRARSVNSVASPGAHAKRINSPQQQTETTLASFTNPDGSAIVRILLPVAVGVNLAVARLSFALKIRVEGLIVSTEGWLPITVTPNEPMPGRRDAH